MELFPLHGPGENMPGENEERERERESERERVRERFRGTAVVNGW